jgi:hypothetical protein
MLAVSPKYRPAASTLPLKGMTQVGVFLAAYLVYTAARFVTIGDLPSAQAHADWIVGLERSLGVNVEAPVQRALDGSSLAMWLLNHVYLAAQLGVLPLSLIVLYHRSRPVYLRLRNTILATWLISVPVYALFPTAPPRLAHVGLVDTISTQAGISLDSNFSTSFYNPLAAVPSLHVGFAVAIGIAVAATLRHPLLKLLALLWGPAVALAVVATGNHFVFDMVAGVAASAAGYGLGAMAARVRIHRPSTALRPALAEA